MLEGEFTTGHVANASAGAFYLRSMYWTTVTMVTIGFGDIVPVTREEMLVTYAVQVLGMLVTYAVQVLGMGAVGIGYSWGTRGFPDELQ